MKRGINPQGPRERKGAQGSPRALRGHDLETLPIDLIQICAREEGVRVGSRAPPSILERQQPMSQTGPWRSHGAGCLFRNAK